MIGTSQVKKGALKPNPAKATKKNMAGKADATAGSAAPKDTNAAKSGKMPSMREIQEQKMKDRQQKIEDARRKVIEEMELKRERAAKRAAEAKRKERISMHTFVFGLFIMLSVLIYFFQSTTMIIFSTLLMFTFFFLGIAYQRMVMQLLVIALACVAITAAFYTIMSSF